VPKTSVAPSSNELSDPNLLRATSGRGIVNLHHTITRYSIERVRKLLSQEDYSHMVNSWIQFLGDKKEGRVTLKETVAVAMEDYEQFYDTFSKLEAGPVTASLQRMATSGEGRHKLARFLIQGLCDQYQGSYDPHYVTGLGSTLWLLDRYWKDTPIATNGLYQYVDYFFSGLR
jgi:hypothetical protein